MDLRTADEITQLREMIDRALSRINTALPGVIDAFDAATQTATVIPAIKMRVNVDGTESFMDLPPIINAPLIFPFASTAGFALTLPVKKGDPCIILFSQRSIDNWHDKGGIQPPEEGVASRHHDLTDALVLMAASPLPDVLGAWEADGVELRNREKTTRVTVKDTTVVAAAGTSILTLNVNGTATLVAPTKVTVQTALAEVDAPQSNFTGNVSIAGGLTCTGTFGASGGKIQTPGNIESTAGEVKDKIRTMAADRAIYNGHAHPGDSGGTTGLPLPQQ